MGRACLREAGVLHLQLVNAATPQSLSISHPLSLRTQGLLAQAVAPQLKPCASLQERRVHIECTPNTRSLHASCSHGQCNISSKVPVMLYNG